MQKGWLIGGAVFLVALVVASVVVALREREASLDEGTPEATVQQFLRAVEDEDYQLVHSLFAEDLIEDCTVEELFSGNTPVESRLKNDRITLERTSTVNETVFVTVRVSQVRGSGPFGASESSFEQRFALRQEDGEWRFSDYPWPFFRCGPFTPQGPSPAIPAPLREPQPARPAPPPEPAS